MKFFVLLVAVAPAFTNAQPAMTAGALRQYCGAWLSETPAPHTAGARRCEAYANGVLEGLFAAELAADRKFKLLCPPAGVTLNDSVTTGVRRLLASDVKASDPAAMLLTEAYMAAYPCRD